MAFAAALLVAGFAGDTSASAEPVGGRAGFVVAAADGPSTSAKADGADGPAQAGKSQADKSQAGKAQAGKADDGKADSGDDDDDDDSDAKHYPQPVRAGTLIGRDVIAPVESQNLLGHVRAIVRNGDGSLAVVMTTGGLLGFGGHSVCVPLDSLSLTGYAIQATGIGTDDLKALPVCDGAGSTPVGAYTVIQVGLAKPAH